MLKSLNSSNAYFSFGGEIMNEYTFVSFSCFSLLSITSNTILNSDIHAYS